MREIENDALGLSEIGVTVVDFYATWCGPCKMLATQLPGVQEELGEAVEIVKADIDKNPELVATYGVMSVPTVIIFKNGEKVDSFNGFKPKEAIKEIIEKHL